MDQTSRKQTEQIGYHTELIVSGLLMVGVILLISDVPFHIIIQNSIQLISDTIVGIKSFFISIFVSPLRDMEFSDLAGMILIAISFGLMIGQLRKRMISTSFESHSCPECNETLHRIHRSKGQLMISKILYLSSGYYRCETCDHSSLRFYPKTPHLHHG